MRKRLPLVLSSAAFVLALLGMTPLGEAARQAVPPFAGASGADRCARSAGRERDKGDTGAPGLSGLEIVLPYAVHQPEAPAARASRG